MSSLRVWSKFTRKNTKGSVLKFRIQDLPQYMMEDAVEFYINNFVKEEPLQKAAGIPKSLAAMRESRLALRESFKDPMQRTVICCTDNEPDTVKDILAAYSLKLATKDDSVEDIKNEISRASTIEMQKYGEMLLGMSATMLDVMNEHGIEKCYDDRGGAVDPAFRDLGLATEILRVIRTMCIEHGVPMAVAWMTSLGTQKGAAKTGWETIYQTKFDDLSRRYGVTFENAPPNFKLMVHRV